MAFSWLSIPWRTIVSHSQTTFFLLCGCREKRHPHKRKKAFWQRETRQTTTWFDWATRSMCNLRCWCKIILTPVMEVMMPIDEHGFSLHKSDFRDAVCLRYGWPLPHLHTDCICGTSFIVQHAFTCSHGGYPTLRHNEIRDLTAQLMSEVCPDVATEPTLQPVSNERFFHRSANTECGALLDVRAQGFWGVRHQQAYFDVLVLNPLADTNRRITPTSCFQSHDWEKRGPMNNVSVK